MDKTKVAVSIFDKLAKEYQNKFMDVSLYADTFDNFSANIKKNAKVLELACGPGNITKYLLQKRPDLKISGIDLSKNMIALAKLNNPSANFSVMDCRDISSLEKAYDAVMCGFLMPYLSKEEAIKLIKNISEILRVEGVIYLSTMEDDYSKSGFKKGSSGDEMFMHYHEAGYLIQALEINNFTVMDVSRKVSSDDDGTLTTDLVVIAKKQD